MEVTFDLTIDDHWHYRKHRMRHDLWYFPVRFFAIFMFGFFMGLFFNHDWALSTFMSCVVTPLYFTHAVLTTKTEVRKRLDRYPYLLKQQKVIVAVQGISWEGDFDRTQISWLHFVAIEDNGKYILLRFRGWYALIVPKRVFDNPSEAQAFFLAALSFWQSAKTGEEELGSLGDNVWPPPPQIGV